MSKPKGKGLLSYPLHIKKSFLRNVEFLSGKRKMKKYIVDSVKNNMQHDYKRLLSSGDIVVVNKGDFEGKWPFKIDTVEIRKTKTNTVLKLENNIYYLTGPCIGKNVSELKYSNILLENKDIPGTNVSLSDFIIHIRTLLRS